jgi:hypothetical protein
MSTAVFFQFLVVLLTKFIRGRHSIKMRTSFLNKKGIEIYFNLAAVVATYSYQPVQGSPRLGWPDGPAQCFVGFMPAFALGTPPAFACA